MGRTKFWDAMNKTVKVVVPQIKPPYVNYANYSREYERSERYGPGIVWEILREMAESLNLTYDIRPLDCPDRHNSNTQDNWDCAFNKLMKGSADIIVGGSVMKGKSNRSDVTFPFFHQKSGILIRNAEFSNFVSMALFEAFSWEVWLGVVVSVFAAFAFLRIIHRTASALLDSNPRQSSAMDSFWVVFSIFTRQTVKSPFRLISSRILSATLFLTALFLMTSFSSSLVSMYGSLTQRQAFYTFRGLVEALQENRFKVVMDINSKAQAKMIQTRNHSLLGLLRHEVRVNKKVVYIDGIMNGVRLVQSKPGYALIGSMDVLDILAKVECNIVLLKDPVLTTYLTIPVRKTSPYKDYLNRRIPQLIQFGFIEKWTRDYTMALGAKNMRTDIMNRTVRVVVPQIKPPYVNQVEDSLKNDQVRSRPGIVWEILLEMARSLNLTYEVEPLDCPERHNSNTQDNWDCAFNKLSKGSAEIIVGGSVMRGKNNKSDVTFPFFHQKSGILIRSSEYSNFVSMALFEAFSREVWMAVIISIFIAFLFLRITHIISSSILEGNQRRYSVIDSFWIIFSIFTRQTFRGLLEALKDDRYKVVMDMNSRAQARMIQTKNYSLVSQLRYEIEVNKRVVYIDGIMNGVNLVQTQRGYALIASMDVLDILAKVDCNIVLLEEPILSTYLTIPVRKGSPYKDYLNRRIPQLMQHGFIEKWTRNYIMSLGAKSRKTCQKRNLWNLPLKQYRNIFLFLVFGLCTSMFLFICELLIRKYRSCFFF
ncbi:ligated ion channel l-glutamate- and glycine-binding site domain-containing protein [Ditylenchus destructor]|uniref:Ligated ion channel l-glutamate- and glycine-binding site domain-containing protein n=1 Tax=Ditylenchus destructor TaxID=166010 RepID=A0AAD4R0X9_9BILA|nr:ligated ion channel l-glutamate- and glycine-binding site domain-containing protein [Ditylenchus destructor]